MEDEKDLTDTKQNTEEPEKSLEDNNANDNNLDDNNELKTNCDDSTENSDSVIVDNDKGDSNVENTETEKPPEPESVESTESKNEQNDAQNKENGKVGIIKLVSLSKLIDKPKAWLKEALMTPEIIQLDTDSDDDVQEVKIKENTENRRKKTRLKSGEFQDYGINGGDQNNRQNSEDNFISRRTRLKRGQETVRTVDSNSANITVESVTVISSDEDSDDEPIAVRVRRSKIMLDRHDAQKAAVKSKFDRYKEEVNKKKKFKVSSVEPSMSTGLRLKIQRSCSPCSVVLEKINLTGKSSPESQNISDSESEEEIPLAKLVEKSKKKPDKSQSNESGTSNDEDDVVKTVEEIEMSSSPKETQSSHSVDDIVTVAVDDKVEEDTVQENGVENKSSTNGHEDDSEEEENLPLKFLSSTKSASSETKSDEKIEKDDSQNDKNEQSAPSSGDEFVTSRPKVVTLKKKRKRLVTSDESGNEDGAVDKPDNADSEDEHFKPKLRRKKSSSSDDDNKNSSNNEDEDGSTNTEKTKTRRRIVRLSNDSNEDNSEDGEDLLGKSRKKIRRVLKDDSLSEKTKDAAKEEMERKKRIQERQKLYNDLCEGQLEEKAKLDKVVLDFDPKRKKDLIKVHPKLVEKLKPHQAAGVKFMWDCCFESLELTKKNKGSGCILAHCMGLGKTLQVIALIHTLLTHESTGVKRVMVVSPLSTVLNWVNEFKIWLSDIHDTDEIEIFEITKFKKMYERSYRISDWHESGGVLIIGYEMFRNLTNITNKRIRKKIAQTFQSGLIDPGPDLIICDEGHLLKNEKSRLSIVMNKIKTMRRIVLTGTPLQNNLKEYYCMINFVKPNLLGTYKEYTNRFVNPITNGQYTDSTPRDIELMKRRSHVLHKILDGVVQRRDYSVLAPFLPPKHEYVLFLTLRPLQVTLYETYMREFAKKSQPGKAVALFTDFQELQRIWTHPRSLRYYSDNYEKKRQKRDILSDEDSEGSLRDFIDDDDATSSTPSSNSSEDEDDERLAPQTSKRRITRARANEMRQNNEEVEEVVEQKDENPTEWWCKYVDDQVLEDITYSSKLTLLFGILKKCEVIGDKVLIFSQSLFSLDVIEYFLEKIDEATQNGKSGKSLGGHKGSWTLGLDYFRLDGSSSVDNRAAWCNAFNDPENIRARLFLISTKAGGLGINLVAANRVIIFDVSWNPSHDIQSIFRIYRFGQNKPCYIYRFIAMGTMEEKVYERQVTKQAISKRVIDEHQIDRHYNQNDLNELYGFSPVPEEPRPIPMLPKDRLLAELLREYDKEIFKYHEHDSLLENKEEEELDEEERKAAWEEFESEKNRPPPTASIYSTVMPRLQMSIQEASIAVEMMLRQQNPRWSEINLRQSVPLLVQQMYQLAAAGDWTMYNRILNYKMTLQQQQWAAQTRLIANNNANYNYDGSLPQAPLPIFNQSKFNPNEVVNLDND